MNAEATVLEVNMEDVQMAAISPRSDECGLRFLLALDREQSTMPQVTPPSSPMKNEELKICNMFRQEKTMTKTKTKPKTKIKKPRKAYTSKQVTYTCLVTNEDNPTTKSGFKKEFRNQKTLRYTAAKGRLARFVKSPKKTEQNASEELASLQKTIASYESKRILSEGEYFYEIEVSIDPITIPYKKTLK